MVASPILGPSHPDLVSAWSLADLALVGSICFVPCDGPYLGRTQQSGLRAQSECLAATDRLIREHPLIITHPEGDHKLSNGEYLRSHLVKEARQRIGVTLKPHPPAAAAERAKFLYENYGVRIFRIFDPRDTPSLPRAVEAVMKACPEALVFASQVTGVESAIRCKNAGAVSVIVNIGDGRFCKTASGTGMSPNNPVTFYRIQKEQQLLSLGHIVDGGVGAEWVLALALGATGSMKHGSLIGGTINQNACLQVLRDPRTKEFVKLCSGEAGKRNKHRGGNFDITGEPDNVEGDDDHVPFLSNELGCSVAEILYRDLYRAAAKQMAFWQATRLEELFYWNDPLAVMPTSGALHMAAPHKEHTGGV